MLCLLCHYLLLSLHDVLRCLVCLLLVAVTQLSDGELALHLIAVLLHHVGQLVGQQFPATRSAGVVRPLTEKDVLADREGLGVQPPVEHIGLGVGVHPDAAEVGTKGWLHSGAHSPVQRLPPATHSLDGLFHIWRDFRIPFTLPGQGQHPLHVAVPILPLQLEQGMHAVGWLANRGAVQRGSVGAGA